MESVPYRRLFGCLLYAANNRPDIKGALAVLGRFLANPGKVHWRGLKRVLIYLKTTRPLELALGGSSKDTPLMEVMVDADHGGCLDTRRSTSGIIIKVLGSAVTSVSKRQTAVANSTTAAEFFALAAAVRRISTVKLTLTELGYDVPTVEVQTDSRCVVDMLKKGHPSERTKHFLIDFYEVKEKVEDGTVSVIHIPGVTNTADLLTKSLPRAAFEKHRKSLLNGNTSSGSG